MLVLEPRTNTHHPNTSKADLINFVLCIFCNRIVPKVGYTWVQIDNRTLSQFLGNTAVKDNLQKYIVGD